MTTNVKLQVGKLSVRKESFAGESNYASNISQGFKQLETILKKCQDQLDGEVTAGIMLDALRPTFELMQQYTPYRTGALRESEYLEITDFRGSPRVEIGAARGGDPFYAVIVHENSEMMHKPPTRSHFVLAAVMEDTDNIWGRLQTGFRKCFDEAET